VRRSARHDDEYLIQVEDVAALLGKNEMTDVGRVEGSSQ
jgi:hypothetical protein